MVFVECKSHDGSIKHYYHFFFACLIPLINYHINHPNTSIILTSDIGTMKSLIQDLPLHSFISYEKNKTENPFKIVLPAYDIYDTKYFLNQKNQRSEKTQKEFQYLSDKIREDIVNYFEKNVCSNNKRRDMRNNSNILITLIERDSFIHTSNPSSSSTVSTTISSTSTTPTTSTSLSSSSGFSRRHIRNHFELKQELLKYYGKLKFQNIYLERLTLKEQFEIFQSTSILIAQHGASLSNIIFMSSICSSSTSSFQSSTVSSFNKLSHVIEISPPYSRKSKYFYNLANSLNISYSSIYQHRNKGNVSIPAIIKHINCILFNYYSSIQQMVQCSHSNIGQICGNFVENI